MPDGITIPPETTAPELAAEAADGRLIRHVRRNLVLWSGGTTLLVLVVLAIALYAAVAGSRDLGYTIGEYTSTGRGPTGAAVQRFGKYLTVWKRQPNGSWKFVVDGGNGSPGKQTGN